MSLTPIQQSQVDVANAIGADLTYLNPSDERHFDSVLWLYTVAGGLLAAFVTGLMTEAGKLTAQMMVGWIKGRFGEAEEKQKAELDRLAAQLADAQAKQTPQFEEIQLEVTTRTLEESLVILGFPQAVAITKTQSIQKIVKSRLLRR